jgi:hypothetical protein
MTHKKLLGKLCHLGPAATSVIAAPRKNLFGSFHPSDHLLLFNWRSKFFVDGCERDLSFGDEKHFLGLFKY